jgi:hypothetical protein
MFHVVNIFLHLENISCVIYFLLFGNSSSCFILRTDITWNLAWHIADTVHSNERCTLYGKLSPDLTYVHTIGQNTEHTLKKKKVRGNCN